MKRSITALVATATGVALLAGCATEPESNNAPASSSATSSASESTGGESSSAAPPSGDAQPTDTAAASSSADASASPEPSEAPFAADTNPDTGTASADAALVLTSVRTGAQDGFDRVVLEFSGPGTPGWQAEYADAASRQGKGDPINPGGSAILDIQVNGSSIPEPGAATVPAGQITPSGTTVIKGVFNDGAFEGVTHVVLGVDAKKPFRVFSLTSPPRVVIDVQH